MMDGNAHVLKNVRPAQNVTRLRAAAILFEMPY